MTAPPLSVVTLTWLVVVQAVGLGVAEAEVLAEIVVNTTVAVVELAEYWLSPATFTSMTQVPEDVAETTPPVVTPQFAALLEASTL